MNRQFGFSTLLGLLIAPLMAISGCSMSMSIRPPAPVENEQASKTPPPPRFLPDDLIDADSRQSTRVNSFGEFARPGVVPVALNPALQQHTFVTGGFDTDVSVDAEGKWIAFAGGRADGHTHLFRQGMESPLVVQLTDGAADDVQPCISRDGRKIAFSSNRNGRWHVYVTSADGREVKPVTDGDCDDMHPTFSPNGQRLVCCSQSGDSGGEWRLVLVDLTNGQRQEIGTGLFPSWSPRLDADVIAFQKTRARGSRWFSIWTCQLNSADDGSVQAINLTEVAASENAALVAPAWSRDGKSLSCSSIATSGSPARQDVWVMNYDGSNRHRLTDGAGRNGSPCWAPDGNVYFVSDRSGHDCIWSLPTRAGSEQPKIDKTAASDPAEVEP